MKKVLKTLKYFSLTFSLIFVVSCGGLQKMADNIQSVKIKVIPEVLETHAGKVNLKVEITFPPKYFAKATTIHVTPVLVYENGETEFEPVSYQGEKVQGNHTVIPNKEGKTVTLAGLLPFKEEMRKSELFLRITGEDKGELVKDDNGEPAQVERSIAYGVLATSTLAIYDGNTELGDPEFIRLIPTSFDANINYIINKANIRNDELKKESIVKLQKYISESFKNNRKQLKNIELSSYASPDGEYELNDKLAEKRDKTANSYLKGILEEDKLEQIKVTNKTVAEDWDGFKELMQESSVQDKELILRVLSMYQDPEVREREIKNMSEVFPILATNILPQLRRSKINVNIDEISRSDKEILQLAKQNIEILTLVELLHGATLTNDINLQTRLYDKAIAVEPNDWRAYNNKATIQISKNEIQKAKVNLTNANKVEPNNNIIQNNFAVASIIEGDLDKAEEYLKNAGGSGDAINANLGLIAIKKGNYPVADQYLNSNPLINAALAKLLIGQNDEAEKILNNIKSERPMVPYLKAIVAARNDKLDNMIKNLKNSISKDEKYKELARTDMEFSKYFENDSFKSMIN